MCKRSTSPQRLYLPVSYGNVTLEDLREFTTRVESLTTLPREPVRTIFSKIDHLAAISDYDNAPMVES